MREFFLNFYRDSLRDCRRSITLLTEPDATARYLDCGCDDGQFTQEVAAVIGTTHVLGIEINENAAKLATEREVEITASDLNQRFPFEDDSLDVVTANQVIEHLYDTDNFVEEITRVLKPNGYAIISTNNLASWHNLLPLALGYQPFPSDVSSNNPGLGKIIPTFEGGAGSWAHLRIFTYTSLKGLMEYYGLRTEAIVGVGYYPFPSRLANRLAQLDKRHSAYLTLKVRKDGS
jgi:SAM-dependent methyltransferase